MSRQKGYITRQAQRLSDGEINRRRFVMSALSAGVTMPTALSLASKAQAQSPKAGGLLRLAIGNQRSFSRLRTFALANALTEITPTGQVEGELAEHFESRDGHRTWRFHLRRGVSFQDGQSLTPDIVAASLARTAPLLPFVGSVQVTGPTTVRITLSRPEPDFPRRLADPRLVILNDKSSGTGPYRIEWHEKEGVVRLARRSEYWKAGRAHVDAVEMTKMVDLNTRVNAVMAGDVDYADGIDPRAVALVQRAPNVRVIETRGSRNIALKAEDNARLQTVAAHVPRKALVEQLLLGHGTTAPAFDGPGLQNCRSDSLSIAVHDAGVPRTMEAAQMIVSELGKAGLRVSVVVPSRATRDAVHIAWQDGATQDGDGGQSLIVLWANELAAHQAGLRHDDQVGHALENDNARLIERWWLS